MYRGRIAPNKTTGPAMAASFALEKKTESRNAKVISDMQNKKK